MSLLGSSTLINSLDYNDIVVLVVVYLDDIVAGLAVEPTLV